MLLRCGCLVCKSLRVPIGLSFLNAVLCSMAGLTVTAIAVTAAALAAFVHTLAVVVGRGLIVGVCASVSCLFVVRGGVEVVLLRRVVVAIGGRALAASATAATAIATTWPRWFVTRRFSGFCMGGRGVQLFGVVGAVVSASVVRTVAAFTALTAGIAAAAFTATFGAALGTAFCTGFCVATFGVAAAFRAICASAPFSAFATFAAFATTTASAAITSATIATRFTALAWFA